MALAFPTSYRDPTYAALAAAAEQQYNLPRGILDAIRLRGERSNADQVSSAGARTPYQFIPSTRQGMESNYGVDPWKDAPSSTDAAARLLLENHGRAGSWNKAISMYSGGNHPGPSAYRYQARVGDFDTSNSQHIGADQMPDNLPPVDKGYYPLAPERPQMPAPLPGPAPSTNVAAASPVASHKRGGILGALESVFMPDPSSRWAGALRDGLFNAKESQQNYIEGQAAKMLQLKEANAKLQQLQLHGQYVPLGGNATLHMKPDGTTEVISAPSSTDDKTKLIDTWRMRREANPNDPTLPLLEGLIFGGDYAHTPEGTAATNTSRETAARARANATIKAATIRGPASNPNMLPALPPGAKVIH
jgi:hypothetical protein